MNTNPLLTLVLASLAAVVLGLTFHVIEVALFAIAVSTLIVLVAASDYMPKRCYHRLTCAS